jgi:hypothetical protein
LVKGHNSELVFENHLSKVYAYPTLARRFFYSRFSELTPKDVATSNVIKMILTKPKVWGVLGLRVQGFLWLRVSRMFN